MLLCPQRGTCWQILIDPNQPAFPSRDPMTDDFEEVKTQDICNLTLFLVIKMWRREINGSESNGG